MITGEPLDTDTATFTGTTDVNTLEEGRAASIDRYKNRKH